MEHESACAWSYIIGTDGVLEPERIVIQPGLSTFRRPVRLEAADLWKVPAEPGAMVSHRIETFERLYGRIGVNGPRVWAPQGSGYSIWKSRRLFTLALMSDRFAFAVAFDYWLRHAAPSGASTSILLCVKAVESREAFECSTFEAWGVAVPLMAGAVVRSNLEGVIRRAVE